MMQKKLFAGLLLLLVAVGFFLLHSGGLLTLETLKANQQRLSAFYAEHALSMVLAFMLIYVAQTALALPGATIMALTAGAVFGPWLGTLYAVSAATLGAGVSFLLSRYLFRETVRRRFGERLEVINAELAQRGLNYLLFLRLVPIFPFFLINLAAGLTRLRLSTYLLGTFIGMIPGGFAYVNAGASLVSLTSAADILAPRTVASFALLGLLALTPVLFARWRSRKKA